MDDDTTKDLEKQPTENPEVLEKDGSRTRQALSPANPPSSFNFLHLGHRNPPPPKASLDEADIIPEANASWLSLLTFHWISPLMRLGYSRPLEATDLYKLQDHRSSGVIAERIARSFEERQRKAEDYNTRLANGEISPGLKGIWWSIRGQRQAREKEWREKTGRKKPSLALAANDSVFWFFWSAGLLRLISDLALITSPLLVKAIIKFAQSSYLAHRTGQVPPPVAQGIGYALGLFFLQTLSSLAMNHYFYRAMGTGVLMRGALITAIYNKSLTLSTRARHVHPNGKLVNHISTDVSRIDFASQFFHMGWTAPIQLVICLIILLTNLGPSALAGFAVFVVMTPLQTRAMRLMLRYRQKTMVFTDKRAKLLQELLSGIKIIKFFAWEDPYLGKINEVRDAETMNIRIIVILRAAIVAIGISLPALSSVLAFVVYGINHTLNPAIIFTSLTLFNMLRMPLMLFPAALSSGVDAYNAFGRIQEVFEAESLPDEQIRDADLGYALELEGVSFSWDAPPPEPEGKKGKGKKDAKDKKKEKKSKRRPDSRGTDATISPDSVPGSSRVSTSQEPEKAEKVFKIKKTSLEIPRGQVVAIVGPVGAGKSSLLQGLIGEMRKESGSVRFGGSVSYCPQNAWIQNATIRDNICFGRPFESDRYWQAISDSCLDADLKLFPNGDLTEVGERGISLSGGQKQRINICRAIYCAADVQIFDDPLSALDAHVGKSVFHQVFMNNPDGQTKILVTHALHFLPQVDYIYTIADGQIMERGTHAELMANDGVFSKFVTEFGSMEEEEEDADEIAYEVEEELEGKSRKGRKAVTALKEQYEKGKTIMQDEERNTGSVTWKTYKDYVIAGNGYFLVPALLLSLLLVQGAQVMSSYWLVFWQEQQFHKPTAFYMGVYAGLGVSLTITFFTSGATVGLLTQFASRTLHRRAIATVMRAPMSFFETTPLGRIMNRFSKDIDTIDNTVSDSMRMFLMTASNVIGAFVLIAVIIPWFLVAVGAILVAYYFLSLYYRASARELKRLDAILRSSLYAHFSESLTGLATIRAYGETERFRKESEERVNTENRAYWLTITNQRWLGMRVDILGLLLTFVVAILTVVARFTISPAQTGVTLSYIISIQQTFGWLVRQVAELENDMNSVERIMHYADGLEQEPPHEIPERKPQAPWPGEGHVEIRDVVLRYRPELPDVLRGLTMDVAPGEKIGIVGRTGAGKSSIMTALYRLVELSAGSIVIDGVDISEIGLKDLRGALAIIPQDPLLFSGTLRSNLDPFDQFDDAKLWDALKRSYLVEEIKTQGTVVEGEAEADGPKRFSLDTVIEDEGSNLSVGQRSLVSLARALVKDTRVLILDEATASVDYETDRKIQDTIATEFEDRTILCIAHRLQTIIGYDRICVMDAGRIAEFDTPTRLYHMEDGIFRGMCDRSQISLQDIRRAAKLREL